MLGRLCDDLIGAGVHGLTPLGSTGEFAYLSRAQRSIVVQTTIDAAQKRVPVVAGVASTSTADAVAQANPISSSAPTASWLFSKPTFPLKDAQIESYFRAIADAVDIPVVIYTNPQFQRSDLTLDVIARLADASAHSLHQGCLDQYRAAALDHESLRRRHRRVLGVGAYSRRGDADRRRRLDGGPGVRGAAAERRTVQSLPSRMLGRRMELQRKLWRINEAFARYNLAACIKAGLTIQGYDVGDPVAPQAALTADERKAVEAVLRESGDWLRLHATRRHSGMRALAAQASDALSRVGNPRLPVVVMEFRARAPHAPE